MNQPILSEKPAAKYLGLSRSYLAQARCCQKPDGPPYIKIGRAIRYRVADLDEWLNARTVRPGDQKENVSGATTNA